MIIAIMNNKGGTGKTTTCVNLSAALAMAGYSVLLIDLDGQASASLSLGIAHHLLRPSIADVIFDKMPVETAVRHSDIERLDLLTGSMELANTDLILGDMPSRETALLKSLDPIRKKYDFIMLDCAPSISLLTINAFSASDSIIIPLSAEYLALEGMISLLHTFERLKTEFNLKTRIMGVVFTMVNRNLKTSRKVIQIVKSQFGRHVFKTEIKRAVRLCEAPSHGNSIYEYAPSSTSAEQFSSLAREVLDRSGMK